MQRKIKMNLLAIFLIIIYLIIKIIAKNCPDEIAFVFCATVFMDYVKLWIYIYDLSEQFHFSWPWQR